MNRLVAWFANNHVAANLLMALLIVGGLLSFPNLYGRIIPSPNIATISVSSVYRGAGPREIEQGIILPIEEALADLEGIKHINATAQEGLGLVTLDVATGYSVSEILDEVRTRVDSISTFPAGAERAQVRDFEFKDRVLSVSVYGRADPLQLHRLAEFVREELLLQKGVTQISVANSASFELAIEVSEAQLQLHQLRFDDVANAVRAASVEFPAGELRQEGQRIRLRVDSKAEVAEEFAQLPLKSLPNGAQVTVADVASISDGFDESDQYTRFEGLPAANLLIYRVGKQDIVELTDTVRTALLDIQPKLPPGIQATSWADDSYEFRQRQKVLLKSGVGGLALVLIVLMLFLRWQLAAWVALGIAVSFAGTLFFMGLIGMAMSMVSMFAFLLAIGIVVDDAIVVGESVYTRLRAGEQGIQAAIKGAQEVSAPVFIAVTTNIIAFAPILLLPGQDAPIWAVIPVVVMATFFFSLVEALLILPAHLSTMRFRSARAEAKAPSKPSFFLRIQQAIASSLERFIDGVFTPFLRLALAWRGMSVAIFIGLFILFVAVLFSGRIKVAFFPEITIDFVRVSIALPKGSDSTQTEAALAKIQNAIEVAAAQLDAERTAKANGSKQQPADGSADSQQKVVQHVLMMVGTNGRLGADPQNGPHVGSIWVELLRSDKRNMPVEVLLKRARDLLGPMPELTELSMTATFNSSRPDIDYRFTHRDLDQIRLATAEFKKRVSEYPGVYEATDSYRAGQQEFVLALTPSGLALGLTPADLARQVQAAFFGVEAQRLIREREELRVMVRYPAAERRNLQDLFQLRIRTPSGALLPFSEVATAKYVDGIDSINRLDRERTLTARAKVDQSVPGVSAGAVQLAVKEQLVPDLEAKYPGLRATLAGAQEERGEIEGAIAVYAILALLVIYALLAVLFHSYVLPLIVVAVIPFGWIGSIIGHLLLDLEVSLLSACGLIAVMGVVINDSVVLMDYINRRLEEGHTVRDAVLAAGAARFRPIFLTSLTTFVGLLPLMLEKSVQAQFLIPMAVSLAAGVLTTTFVCLILVPVLCDLWLGFRLPQKR